MKRSRSLLMMVALPAIVSLAVTLLVLAIADAQKSPEQRVIILPTHSGTALISSLPTQAGANGGSNPVEPAAPGSTDVPAQPIGPGCENPSHVVVPGETLGVISEQYGVSVDNLIVMNQAVDPLFDPDFLSVGQALVVPSCGIPTSTVAPTPTDTLVPTRDIPTPIATATEPAPGTTSVKISRVLNIGDITREAVEILNEGSPVDLKDWTLSDGRGQEYAFPAFRLFTGGGVTVYSGVGQDTPINLFWGLTESLWEIGDTISLSDAAGNIQHEFEILK